jgi:hypothetical protein
LRWISVCGHAIVSTPVGSVVSVAAPESSSGNFPTDGGLPQPISGSAPTLNFSRIAQRSLALRPACSLDRHAAHVSRRLRRLRHLHRRFDSYRLERPSCRAGIAPAEDPHLTTAHNWLRSRRRSSRAGRGSPIFHDPPSSLINDHRRGKLGQSPPRSCSARGITWNILPHFSPPVGDFPRQRVVEHFVIIVPLRPSLPRERAGG